MSRLLSREAERKTRRIAEHKRGQKSFYSPSVVVCFDVSQPRFTRW